MRLGYSYWGFLGDFKEDADGNALSTPDGNATYSWSIIHEARKRGWTVWAMQQDRDQHAFMRHGGNFAAFSERKRIDAYVGLLQTNGVELPELDVLLVEWRMPILGRNTNEPMPVERALGSKLPPGLQPDLYRQAEVLNYYRQKGTKIIIWDLDHKLTHDDEGFWTPDAIFETSVTPLHQQQQRTRVEPPTVIDDLMQFPTLAANPLRRLAYIGSRYERDDVITEYVKPVSDRWPFQVEFWGNWLRTVEECRKLWPRVSYNDRITTRDFRKVYGEAVACPLLAKRSYLETGFITPRPWEALLFGTLPVGISQAKGIDQYCLFTAGSGEEMVQVVEQLSETRYPERNRLREESIQKLLFMDVKHFADRIEEVANGSLTLAQGAAESQPTKERGDQDVDQG